MANSIIIVAYNGIEYLKPCIDSVLFEIDTDDEIILVDNASTDGSVEVVQELFPQVRLIHNVTNLGFAAASNQGVSYATGKTLIFLNQDTRVQPGWLSGLLAPLEQDATIGLVTSKLVLMRQPEKIHMCGQDIHFSGLTFGRGFLSPSKEYLLNEKVGAVSGASFAIRRSLWEQLGGFDAGLFMYYEETDLCWRAKLSGFSSLYSSDSVVWHDYSLKSSAIANFYSERNRLVLLLKNWKWVTLFLLLPSLLLAEMIDWGYMLLVGWEGVRVKFNAWTWLMVNLPAVLSTRAKVQVIRKEADWVLLNNCTYILTPRIKTGGWIGRGVVSACNLWFGIHYKVVFFILHSLNI